MIEPGEPLSDRELDVLTCVVQGAANKEIAAALFISENTVKVHLRRIYAKLGVSSRTEAATAALQRGLVAVPGLEATDPTEPAPSTAATAAPPPAMTATAVSVPPHQEETAVPAPTPRPVWRNLGLGAAFIALLALLWLLLGQQQNGAAPAALEATPQSCREQPLGDSRWLVSQPMPVARAGMAVAAVGLDVYLLGGETGQEVVNRVDVYDTINCQWRVGAPKPTAVTDTTAVVLFGEIYVPGGRGADGQPTSIVEVYSPANKLWRAIAPLPVPLSGGLALAEGGHLYLFGGWDGAQYLDSAYEYNPSLDSWQAMPSMSQPRAFATGGSLGGLLYVLGGYDGASELSLCATFDTAASAWLPCPPLLQARAGAGAVVLLNKLYVVGGGLQPGSSIPYGEEYNPATQTWQVVETPMVQEAGQWFLPGVTNVETRIYAFGGRWGEALMADTFVLRAVFQTFLPAMPSP